MADQRASIRSDYLGDFPAESYADAFVDAVRDVATRRVGGSSVADDEEGRDAAESELSGDEADPVEEEVRAGLRTRIAGYRRVLESIVLNLAGTGFALLALMCALLGAAVWLSVVVGLVGFLIGVSGSRKDLLDRTRWERLARTHRRHPGGPARTAARRSPTSAAPASPSSSSRSSCWRPRWSRRASSLGAGGDSDSRCETSPRSRPRCPSSCPAGW